MTLILNSPLKSIEKNPLSIAYIALAQGGEWSVAYGQLPFVNG